MKNVIMVNMRVIEKTVLIMRTKVMILIIMMSILTKKMLKVMVMLMKKRVLIVIIKLLMILLIKMIMMILFTATENLLNPSSERCNSSDQNKSLFKSQFHQIHLTDFQVFLKTFYWVIIDVEPSLFFIIQSQQWKHLVNVLNIPNKQRHSGAFIVLTTFCSIA